MDKNEIKVWREDCLKAHNEYRRLHGVPPLRINTELNAMAQRWAHFLIRNGKFEHSTRRNFKESKTGENLWGCSGLDKPNARYAVKGWYEERENYDFNNQGFSMLTGHFTAVVWLATEELGVGIAGKGDSWILCCNYYPAGNINGKFEENVFPFGQGPLLKGYFQDNTSENSMQPENLNTARKTLKKKVSFADDAFKNIKNSNTKNSARIILTPHHSKNSTAIHVFDELDHENENNGALNISNDDQRPHITEHYSKESKSCCIL